MDSSLLNQRLVGYLAAAGITVALAPAAGAQIVYTNVDPDATVNASEEFAIDLDGDGVDDLTFASTTPTANTLGRVVLANANAAQPTNGVAGINAPYFADDTVGSASNLAVGAPVDATRNFYRLGVLASVFQGTPYYQFIGQEGYAGFRFVAGTGATHFGWARVSATEDATAGTLLEYAYESTPDTQIMIGNTGVASEPDALAEGYRFSPLAPNPTTGTSSFEVAVGQAESVRVEAFDALGRSVAVLHDGLLAAGQSRRLTLDASALPAGVYVVRVSGDSFVTTRRVTVAR